MSLWAKAQHLPQIRAVYGEQFPIEVRHYLAQWIEERFFSEINLDLSQYDKFVSDLVASFVQEIESKANSMNGEELFLARLKLIETAKLFKTRFSANPSMLYRLVKNNLMAELRLVQQTEMLPTAKMVDCKANVLPYGNPAFVEINQEMETQKMNTQEHFDQIKHLDTYQQGFSLKYFEFQKINGQLADPRVNPQNQEHMLAIQKLNQQKNSLEVQLRDSINNIVKAHTDVIEKLSERYVSVALLQSRILDNELITWKRSQQLAGNGCDFDTSHLDILQSWCEGLAEITWSYRTQTKEIKRLMGVAPQCINIPPGIKNNLFDLENKFTELLTTLVTSTFIIEKQPPQVMKTNTRFSAKVRLLVGAKLNVHMTPPQVKVSIISEAQANYLLTEKAIKGEVSGDILNNTGTMEYDQTTRQLSITFRNMQLKKIKRAEKKGSESVVDEKFSLYFSSSFSIGGDLAFTVWTLSLPVTVIVHGNQEPHAWATITWDNAFAEPGRKPFVVPDKVHWGKVANALNLKFASATGRPLTVDNVRYLAEKLFRMQSDDYDTLQLSWAQFSKESLVDRNFTFWDWFYAIMKLTREHLKPLWMDGSILGFVRKKQAEDMLSTCANGTFLLRFSDSELGGVTIAWVGGSVEQKEVFMLQPFTAKDFAIRSLADRLNDLSHLLYLFPDISKEKAFGRYYTPFTESQPTSSNGYVKPLLVTHVPGWGNPNQSGMCPGGGLNSYPNTPHSMMHPHSPGSASVMSEPSGSYGINHGTNEMDYFELCGIENAMDVPDIELNFNTL